MYMDLLPTMKVIILYCRHILIKTKIEKRKYRLLMKPLYFVLQ